MVHTKRFNLELSRKELQAEFQKSYFYKSSSVQSPDILQILRVSSESGVEKLQYLLLPLSIFSSLTWYNQSEVCAARTSDRRLCLSTLHFGGPSTAAWPDHWCPLCARGSCGGAHQDLSWISQPAKIQFSNTDHKEKSLSGAKILFSEEQVCRSILSATNRPVTSVLQLQPLPAWAKRLAGYMDKRKRGSLTSEGQSTVTAKT